MPTSQLIPPPELAPPGIAHLSAAERILLWARLEADGLGTVYREIWRDAFPDESPPDCV